MFYLLSQNTKLNISLRDTENPVLGIMWASRKNLSNGNISSTLFTYFLFYFILDLEKKIQDLNLSRQEKADQLKQLEDQVIAIKNEIVEQENKYSTC